MITEGKTKKLTPMSAVRIESKDDITAGDGRKHDLLRGKAFLANRTTCNVFELLLVRGIPVAYYMQDSGNSFIAPLCRMLPWEIVTRAEAHGSYLKRNSEVQKGQSLLDSNGRPLVERFLKTSGKKWKGYDLPCDDPLALHIEDRIELYLPNEPILNGGPFLTLGSEEIYEEAADSAKMRQAEKIAAKAFMILHRVWSILGRNLVDMKVEFGISPYGSLLLADVIDNDSWRLLEGGTYIDKQAYRDDGDIDLVRRNYLKVAEATDQFSRFHDFWP